MWKTLRDIARGTTFYYQQLNFFLILALIGTGFIAGREFLQQSSFSPQAATELPRSLQPPSNSPNVSYTVTLTRSGDVKVNGTDIRGAIVSEPNREKFLLVLVRENPQFTNLIQATVQLPTPTDELEQLRPRVYAIHGAGTPSYEQIDGRTVRFIAPEVVEGATVSIEFDFPKGYFDYSLLGRLRSASAAFPPQVWIGLAILFPALTGLFLLILLVRRVTAYMRVRNNLIFPLPPASTAPPPALIGTLYHGKIGRPEVTATLFNLAQRGFITMHQTMDERIIFGKGTNLFTQEANTLRPFEIFLLHQIFGDEGFKAKGQEVESGLTTELFSQRIAMTIINIYDAAVAEGYFIQSPNRYYQRYKFVGIMLFFVALAALLYGAFVLPARGYVLFLWAGMVVASLLIVSVTPGLPSRTPRGDQTLKRWMGFRNYLSVKELVKEHDSKEFFDYLPYAIVLDCEREWIARWSEEALVLPEWFSAEQQLYTASDYQRSLIAVIDFLSQHLVAARPPDLA